MQWMAPNVPEDYLDLLDWDRRAFATLATIMEDGSPQATPIWFDVEGDLIMINSARGRVKVANMEHRPQVALSIMDPDDPYRYLQIRGEVVEVREQTGKRDIDRLANKYLGKEEYPWYEGETRVSFLIRPRSTSTQ
jgi:PPOX class probable F420-dependent enzyme